MAKVKIKLVGNWDAWGPGAREGQMTRGDGDRSRVLVQITGGGASPGVAQVREEARVIGRIRDPQILRLLHMNVVQRQVLRVYEGFEGASLAVILRVQRGASEQVPVKVALEVGHAVARAFQVVQGGLPGDDARVVHPGPGPQHVLVDAHGRVKLAGLAVASFVSQSPDDLLSPYRPPEGLLGDAVASYQVGALIAELLAGEPPARAGADRDSHEAMLRRIMIRVLARPGDPAREGVVSVVRSCLAFEPTQRPALGSLVDTLGQLGRDAAMPGVRAWCAGVVPGVLRASQSPVDRRPLAAPATEEVPLVRPVASPVGGDSRSAGKGVLPLPADDGRLPVSIGPLVPDATDEDLAPTTVLPAEERGRVLAAVADAVAPPAPPEPGTTSVATERVSPVPPEVSPAPADLDHGAAMVAAGGAEPNEVLPVDVDVRADSAGGTAAALNIALDDDPDEPPPRAGRGVGLLLLFGLLGASALILGAGAWWWFNGRSDASPPQLSADVVASQGAEPASATLAQEEPQPPEVATPEGDDSGDATEAVPDAPVSSTTADAVAPGDETSQAQDAPPAVTKPVAKAPSKPAPTPHASPRRAARPQSTAQPKAPAPKVDDSPAVNARILPTSVPDDAPTAAQPAADASPAAATAAVAPPAVPVASDTFKVVFRSADPSITEIDVRCHVGSGHGPSPVIIADAGRGPCKVTGHAAAGRLIVMVSLVNAHEFTCFEAGARSCR